VGFPENVLARGEKVVKNLHPHWLTVFGASLVGVLVIAAAAFASWATPDDTTGNRIQWVSVGVAALLFLALVVVPFLRWRTTHYVVTTHRVMVRRGILSKEGKDITLSKVTDVSFRQSFLDRLIRAGTLNIESAGDSADELLRNIPNSDDVQQLINALIDEDANRRAGRIIDGRTRMDEGGEGEAASAEREGMPRRRREDLDLPARPREERAERAEHSEREQPDPPPPPPHELPTEPPGRS